MEQLLSLGALIVAWYAIGWLFAVPLSLKSISSKLLWNLAIGAVVGGMVLSWIGLVGRLNPSMIRIVTYLLSVLGLSLLLWDCRIAGVEHWRFKRLPKLSVTLLGLAGCGVIVGSWIVGLSPPIAGDALCYHLFLPKVFLNNGGIDYLPFTEESSYPLLTEIWFLWALVLGPDSLPNAVSLVLGLLMAGGITSVAMHQLQRQDAFSVGCLTLLVPAISVQCAVALNDLAVATFCVLGFAAYLKAQSSGGWYLVCGLMLAAAGSIKFTAGMFFAATAVAGLVIHALSPQRYRLKLKPLLGIAALMLVLMGPWYARSAYHTGNPIYPYLESVFPTDAPQVLRDSKRPLKVTELATSAWQLTMFPEKFGGRAHQLGFLPLALLPGILLLPREPLTVGTVVLCGGYFLLWYFLKQNTRFLLPIVPFLMLLCVMVWREAGKQSRWLGFGFTTIVLLSTLLNAGIAAQRTVRHLPSLQETTTDYLHQFEPTYEIATAVNRRLDQDSCILSQELRLFYFDVPIWRESIVRRKRYPTASSWSEVRPILQEAGFTHVLLVDVLDGEHPGYDRTLQQLIPERIINDPALTLVETEHRDTEGVLRRYRLLQLP